ncbi:MAG: TIR domain-containing protein [Clostridiales bacterium]|nr:TIR domain-containing protein [Clostridiales bacterium]
MIDFYNAFISYRHADLDSKIAEHVQKQLEHFHVPHKLKKKLKHEKITRIFRDKDELPITSDLTETITNALEKAEYLIVICSTNTKESMWVKREIKTFLKTHTMDKVLTVLCNGEPYEVIPEELLTTTKEYVDETGMTHTVEVPIEPLSCDYRLPKSTADKEELPRLASALLGCSYDELQRRRRQYRIRRATAIVAAAFAVLLGLGTYLGYTTKKINDSYMASLRSRSLYLSNEAEQLLADGKRTDALQVALAALPNDSQKQMPVTAEAQRAITDATGAYESLTGTLNYTSVWNYKTTGYVRNIILSENKKYLASYDSAGIVYCWNAYTNQLLLDLNTNEKPVDLLFLEDAQLLVVFANRIESYHVESGSLVWKYQSDSDYSFLQDEVVFADHAVYLDIGNGELAKLSAKDGRVMDTYKVQDGIFTDFNRLTVSPDGKKLAFVDNTTSYGIDKITLLDTETGKLASQEVEGYLFSKLQFVDNDHLIMISDNDGSTSSIAYSNNITYVQTGYMQFFCFDTSMKQIWSYDLDYTDVMTSFGAFDLPDRDSVLLHVGNHAVIADKNTGAIINDYKTSSSIVTVNDHNKNGNPEFICRHGEYILTLGSDSNQMASINVLGDIVSKAIISDKIYTAYDYGTDIVCHNYGIEDDEWSSIDAYGGFYTGTSYQKYCNDGENLIIASKMHDVDIIRVSVIDMNTTELVFSEDVEFKGGYLSHFELYNIDDEIYGFFGNNAYLINIDKERVEDAGIELSDQDDLSNGMIINCNLLHSQLTAEVWKADGSNHKEFEPLDLENLDFVLLGEPIYVEQINKFFVSAGNRLFAGDLDSETFEELDVPDDWSLEKRMKITITASDDGSRVFFSDGNIFFVTDESFKELYSTNCLSSQRYGAKFRDGILYLLSDDYLILYDSNDGSLIKHVPITAYGTGDMEIYFDEKNNQLFIQTEDQICILDAETWIEIASIENAYCYHEGTDRFFVYSFVSERECKPGYIKHYTIDELIEKAHNYLGNQEVPAELKNKYGI